MTTLKLNFAAILFAFFALVSCQKDGMEDFQQATTTTEINTERNLPEGGIHLVNEAVQTQASARVLNDKSTSRSREVTRIECGTTYDGNTTNQGNSLNTNHYPSCIRDLGASFAGEDQIFYLVVPETPEAIVTYDISLTGMSQDLDLFLLALDSRGYISECKAISIGASYADEQISVTGLHPGAYAVIVDAYEAGIASQFQLAVTCSAVSANPPTAIAITDNVRTITTTQTSYFLLLGKWYENDPTFPPVFEEIARDENSITIERKLVDGNSETSKTLIFNLIHEEVTIIEETKKVDHNGAFSTFDMILEKIVKVAYD